ncbi:MAG: 16S rRNA (cytosine(1402)-N(4))-methyltransferase RsmH [Planctomycetota bacterium]
MPTPSEPRDAHLPVLPEAVLRSLAPEAGETYADATAGLGGHAAVIAERLGTNGRVVLNDLDRANLDRAVARVRALAPSVQIERVHGNFAELPRGLEGLACSADLVLADLGFASVHVDTPERGFSFKRDGPLDMRYDTSRGESASDLVHDRDEAELADVLWEFGEERRSRAIARAIVASRERNGRIETTGRLADVVRSVVGGSSGGVDGATRTFQALRIAVNDELGSLDALLAAVGRAAARTLRGEPAWLAPGARVGVISFQSLEDRRVKRAFGSIADRGHGEIASRRPIEADADEVDANPRARSAKLRVIRLARPM